MRRAISEMEHYQTSLDDIKSNMETMGEKIPIRMAMIFLDTMYSASANPKQYNALIDLHDDFLVKVK